MHVVKVYAEWCGPCKVLDKMLQESNIEYKSVDIDSSEGEELSLTHKIRGVPTLLILDDNNNLIRKKVGLFLSNEDLIKFINEDN